MNSVKRTFEEFDATLELFKNLSLTECKIKHETMDQETLQTLLNTAVKQAAEETRAEFQGIVDELYRKIAELQPMSAVKEYRDIEIVDGVSCDESLDIVKSVPEFKGEITKYVSWRQAATTAHKLFERYEGSSKYYQAVAILRNKIVEKADSVLSTYNTVLNFYAIIDRLDFAYADKTSIYALEQELFTLKQGRRSICNFYNDVECKLTSIINKVIMSYEGDTTLIKSLNQKYRMHALRVFISGLRKPLCDILFSCKPTDLPSALTLAQELETNQNRFRFATIYNNGLTRFQQNPFAQTHQDTSADSSQLSGDYLRKFTGNIPLNNQMQQAFSQGQQYSYVPHSHLRPRANVLSQNVQNLGFQPRSLTLDSDVSMRTAKSNNSHRPNSFKSNLNLSQQNIRNVQKLNHLCHEVKQPQVWEETPDIPSSYDQDQTSQSISYEDEINFLGEAQFYPTSKEQ